MFHLPSLLIHTFFYQKLRSSVSTESFSIFVPFSIVMRTIAYRISIAIEWKVEFKFLVEEFLIKKCVDSNLSAATKYFTYLSLTLSSLELL